MGTADLALVVSVVGGAAVAFALVRLRLDHRTKLERLRQEQLKTQILERQLRDLDRRPEPGRPADS